jgi:phosphoglycolate phosphatase
LISRSIAASAAKARSGGLPLPGGIEASGIADNKNPFTIYERIDDYPGFSGIIDGALPLYRTIYAENSVKNTKLYPGMKEWLEALSSQGKTLAVLSNKADASSQIILGELGVADHFAVIAGPDGTGAIKPDPAALGWVMHKAGFEPGDTVMIGDSMVDFAAARNAGVAFCGITGGLGEDEDLRKAGCDWLIERL